MPNNFQYRLHAVPRGSPLPRHQRGLLLALVLIAIASGLIGLAIGILTINDTVTSAILLICASLLLGAMTYALLLRQRGHLNTKLEQTEAALKASEAWLRLALDAARIGAWEWNMRDGTLNWSDHLEAIFGRAPDTCAGTAAAYLALVHPADQDAVEQAFGAALTGLEPTYTIAHRLAWPDGQLHWLELNGRVFHDASGRPIRAIGTVTDITARKRLEAQLLQAQKMESIGLLAGSIAHDFNNLLTAISGYTQLARDTLPPDELVRQDLDEILKATDKAANLTRQLLAFARKQIIEPHVLNLNDLILNIEKLLRRLIGEDVELVTRVAPDLGLVKVDPCQIEQVLVNMAVNARQAMPHGGTLTIETRNVTLDETEAHRYLGLPPGTYVFLTISDTGVGMDLKTQARIFEPFFTTKGPGEGSGFGLATCYGIIKQHNGHIGVYSEPGHGTCFKIYLPQVADAATTRAPGREQSELPRGSELVLVVEDDPAVRALAARVLRRQGYRVLEATNGNAALHIVRERCAERLALVVTDIVMPRMSGSTLAEQLAVLRPGLKVLFMSGYTVTTIAQRYQLAPGSAFLHKPFTPTALAQKVRAVLDA